MRRARDENQDQDNRKQLFHAAGCQLGFVNCQWPPFFLSRKRAQAHFRQVRLPLAGEGRGEGRARNSKPRRAPNPLKKGSGVISPGIKKGSGVNFAGGPNNQGHTDRPGAKSSSSCCLAASAFSRWNSNANGDTSKYYADVSVSPTGLLPEGAISQVTPGTGATHPNNAWIFHGQALSDPSVVQTVAAQVRALNWHF
jgi:hypothetical protein